MAEEGHAFTVNARSTAAILSLIILAHVSLTFPAAVAEFASPERQLRHVGK